MLNLRDLKKRKLVQWVVVYLAAAWALLQVADVVGSRFAFPDSWLRMLIVVLAVGAVAVLVLAWYHGEQGAQKVSTVELGMLTALLVIAGAAVLWTRPASKPEAAPDPSAAVGTPATRATVAVLPFVNMSDSKENEYFADGITEEILSALARSHALRVISRTSVMQYKETTKPLKQIAAELGAGAVLEGSVRRDGTRVRVTAQLIDARTDEHLWAEDYSRELDDIFAIQMDIAQQISSALHAALSPSERSGIAAGRTGNVEAYDLYLRALRATEDALGDEDLLAAASLYRKSLEVDSTYALAYAGLADVYGMLAAGTDDVWHDSAYAAAGKALALAPQLPEAHAELGNVHWYFQRYREAEEAFRAAIRLDPSHSVALRGLGFALYSLGKFEEAFGWALRATLVDPYDYTAQTLTGSIYLAVGAHPEAEARFRHSLRIRAEKNGWARSMLISQYLEQGLPERAEAELAALPGVDRWTTVRVHSQVTLRAKQYPAAIRLYEERDRIQEEAGAPRVPNILLAYLYERVGERAKAERVLRAVEADARKNLANPQQAINAYYELARVCALRGNRDCALQHLARSLDGELYETTTIRNDVTLESLHDDPAFERMLAQVDRRGEALRARIAKVAQGL